MRDNKRLRRKQEEKEIRRLWMEYLEYNSRRRESGHYIPVTPYRAGWNRTFVLREDVQNRTDARYIRQALDLINNTRFSRKKDFKEQCYKTGKMVPMQQELFTITTKKWEELSPNVQKLFTSYYDYNYYNKTPTRRYHFKYPWMFEFKISARYIREQWVPDEVFEQRRAEIINRIERHNLWPKFNKIMGWKSWNDMREGPWYSYKMGKHYDREYLNANVTDEDDISSGVDN